MQSSIPLKRWLLRPTSDAIALDVNTFDKSLHFWAHHVKICLKMTEIVKEKKRGGALSAEVRDCSLVKKLTEL